MAKLPVCFYSNRVENLYGFLRKTLFEGGPFTKRIVVVPSQAMKRWLMLKLAEDEEVGISGGIEFPFVDRAIFSLAEGVEEKGKFLDSQGLSFCIEAKIRRLVESPSIQEAQLLVDYLKFQGEWNKTSENRLVGLAGQLASLFINYGDYAGELVGQWEAGTSTGWQQWIWKEIYQDPRLTYLYRFVNQACSSHSPKRRQIHLFCLSFMSRIQCEFFFHLAKSNDVYFYLLSPCMAFWTDILSDREAYRLRNFWKKKGASLAQREKLEEYLRESNPLLANWGKVGREYATLLEGQEIMSVELYGIPQSAATIPVYSSILEEEIIVEPSSHSLTLLAAIQADLLLMRNPEASPHPIALETDHSIQVHAATSKLREVQILHDALMAIIAAGKEGPNPICPSDIIVMAPRIADYVPFIRAVFESQEKCLPVQFSDLLLSEQNVFARGFESLVQLSQSRWKVSEILALFENPAFMRRHEFCEEDLQKIKEWIKQVNIRWGQDGGHRNELLSSEYTCQGMQESAATWEHGLEALLLNIIGEREKTSSSIEFSQSELLSKLWKLIRSLREDLIPLTDGSRRSLGNWTSYLDCLLNAYFCPDPFNGEEQEDFAFLAEQLFRLHQAAEGLSEDDLFSFASLLPHLKNTLGQESLSYNEKHLQSVRFCSLLPMRAIPSRVICLLGLEDPVYPRSEYRSSLDLRAGSSHVDYCPSKSDYDRYLFLESLLSARDYFILTYQARALSDGKEQLPSILITELLSYADKFFSIGGELPSGKIVKHHPHAPYHYSHFDPQSSFLSYSNVRYLEACAAYAPTKIQPHRFIPHFYIVSERKALDKFLQDQVVVDLRKLSQCVSKPLQLYLNQSMGIYLKDDDHADLDEESFVCTALDHWQYKQAYLNQSLDAMLARDIRSGKLPLGLWKEAALQSIEKNVLLLENNAKAMGISGERLFNIDFKEKCRRSYKCSENHWILPARELLFGGIQVKLIGRLSGVSSKGLVASREAKFVDVAKLLPAWLALHLVPEECVDLKEKNLLLCGDGQILTLPRDSQDLLPPLFDYYFACMANPCPILPEWIQSVLKGDAGDLQKKIIGSFADRGGTFDRYACWIMQREDLPDAEAIMNLWQGPVAALFGGMNENV